MGRWGGSGATREKWQKKKLAREQRRPRRYPIIDKDTDESSGIRIARQPVSRKSMSARAAFRSKTGTVNPGLVIRVRPEESYLGFERAMRRLKRAQHSKAAVRIRG